MATHDGEKHSRQSLRNSPEMRELAELMTGIAPDRRGDAFKTAEIQDTSNDGKKESTADNSSRRTQAGPEEFGKDVLPTE